MIRSRSATSTSTRRAFFRELYARDLAIANQLIHAARRQPEVHTCGLEIVQLSRRFRLEFRRDRLRERRDEIGGHCVVLPFLRIRRLIVEHIYKGVAEGFPNS